MDKASSQPARFKYIRWLHLSGYVDKLADQIPDNSVIFYEIVDAKEAKLKHQQFMREISANQNTYEQILSLPVDHLYKTELSFQLAMALRQKDKPVKNWVAVDEARVVATTHDNSKYVLEHNPILHPRVAAELTEQLPDGFSRAVNLTLAQLQATYMRDKLTVKQMLAHIPDDDDTTYVLIQGLTHHAGLMYAKQFPEIAYKRVAVPQESANLLRLGNKLWTEYFIDKSVSPQTFVRYIGAFDAIGKAGKIDHRMNASAIQGSTQELDQKVWEEIDSIINMSVEEIITRLSVDSEGDLTGKI